MREGSTNGVLDNSDKKIYVLYYKYYINTVNATHCTYLVFWKFYNSRNNQFTWASKLLSWLKMLSSFSRCMVMHLEIKTRNNFTWCQTALIAHNDIVITVNSLPPFLFVAVVSLFLPFYQYHLPGDTGSWLLQHK